MKYHEFIKRNENIIKQMYQRGDISATILSHYRIYLDWLKDSSSTKMQSYQNIADAHGVSLGTVMAAIKKMDSPVK